ncbi:MAG TPA: M20 family metallopeptidase [Stellaceae bacterium]|jgi:acetylornithine deacetylase/succinyl-diaminopimelate desuccinylase-like protein|nr:M20 family metallopeptidase [Stellaceae bacterium]
MLDDSRLKSFVDRCWGEEVVPTLTEYIKIPNKSPLFDPDWAAHGHMDAAVAMFEAWARAKIAAMPGAVLEVVRLPGRTPLILIEAPGDGADTVLLYGHLDKQPEMVGWLDGYGPWLPRLDGDKLYGRGGADDGYAMFGALTALAALHEQGVAHARCVIVIEACEESGSYDLPFYVDHLAGRIGSPSLVVCLDSGCGNYDQLWLTTSLRGVFASTLTVEVLGEGVHSGDASGVVPSSFRIFRRLLSRLEDEETGAIRPEALYVQVPAERLTQAKRAAAALGKEIYAKFPFVPGMRPADDDLSELVLNRTWRPRLAVTGIDGLPTPGNAGNVLLPFTTAKLSLRLPPTLDPGLAGSLVRDLFEKDPPYGARVTFDAQVASSGWNAPGLAPWLEASLARASETAFGAPPAYMGEGGSIPFMAMLGEKFPAAQFVVTGVLGPHSNAHGPNEFLHIPTGKKVTQVIARVLADHHARG